MQSRRRQHSAVASAAATLLSRTLAIRAGLLLVAPLIYLVAGASLPQQNTALRAPGRHLLAKWQTLQEANCTPAAILDFPADLFSDSERRQGAVVLHALLALYLFVLLAYVCDDYFVPAIERIVQVLQVSDDVGGATLMAAATSSPELFVNVVGTFVTEGDLGVGAVMGSAVFNILAVPACCGIFTSKETVLDWWPMSRDCAVYALSVAALIVCLADQLVFWYEAAALVTLYLLYITLMYHNVAVAAWARRVCTCWASPRPTAPELAPLMAPLLTPSHEKPRLDKQSAELQVSADSLLSWLHELPTPAGLTSTGGNPAGLSSTFAAQTGGPDVANSERSSGSSAEDWQECSLWRLITAPIRLVLWLSIPDCRKHEALYPATFVMCIAWIGTSTYMITWMITILGDTLRIPDSVMGITFLAAGTSVPEAVSSVIVARQGHGSMGISNSIGSNTFDILLCLGLPWLIKSSLLASIPDGEHAVRINSHGLEYSAISLLSSTLLLFVTFACYRFRLNRKVGVVCLALYACFLILASLIELNVFFVVNLPTCGR